jgi:hypothetical protein
MPEAAMRGGEDMEGFVSKKNKTIQFMLTGGSWWLAVNVFQDLTVLMVISDELII